MADSKTRLDRFNARIKNNPIIASLILLGTLIIALSTLTNATKNILGLVMTQQRPDINGEWTAEVTYDWNKTATTETLTFGGDGTDVHGTVSFQGSRKAIHEATLSNDKLQFITKTQEISGDWNNAKTVTQRYRGKLLGDEIEFVLQIEGGSSEHAPIEFTARKIAARSP